MAKFGNIRFLAWMLIAMVVYSAAQKTGEKANECSRDELSKVAPRYAKDFQNRVLKNINFARPSNKDWLIKLPNFKRNLLTWGFNKMDKNRNGLVEPSEAVAGRWSLQGSKEGCRLAFVQQCDEDKSRSVSRQEWLKCFKIQACNKSCVGGQLDKVLCRCQCPQSIIQGQVASSSGSPLRDAAILLGSSPYTELAKTNKSGHFAIYENCESLSYTVTKNGYIPHRMESRRQPDARPVYIRLWDAEPPYITVNPKSKTRIAGQSVNFTCEVEGTPPIKLTWNHNGRPLPEVTMGNRTNLYIANVTGAKGIYTCKATNDYGSEISSPAELKIKENLLDTCNRTPRSHLIQLPDACMVKSTGENVLDVGQCSDEPCSQRSSFNQSCGGKDDCCCGPKPIEYQEKVMISCYVMFGDYRYSWDAVELYRVKECGCGSCLKQNTVIEGQVIGGPNQDPVENVAIKFKNEVLDTTNEDGEFSFVIPDDINRLTVTFVDPEDRFFDTTQTLPFQRGQTVFHRVALQEEDPPVTFESTKELRVPLGHSGDNMAELELPANNLMHKNGTPFEGKAKLRLSLTDPRNASDLISAPGDFTTVDQSGSVQPLKTYGILRIKIQDQNNEPLDLAGNIKLRLDADKVVLPRNSSGEMAPWLWWLNEKTGRWRQLGEMKPTSNQRTKRAFGDRRFYIGDIQTDKISVINIDIPWKRCYVRVQTYSMTGKDVEPSQGVEVTLIGKENTNQEQYYGFTQEVTNKDGIACIPAWCDSNVVLQSSKKTFNYTNGGTKAILIHLNPDRSTLNKLTSELEASIIQGDESNSFTFVVKVTSQAGPIFGGDELTKCLDSSQDNLQSFKFHFKETKQELPKEFSDFGSRPPGHPLSWYTSDAAKPNQEVKKCFARFLVSSYPESEPPMISVQSFTPDRQKMYGFSIKRPTVTVPVYRWPDSYSMNFSFSYACVEYRCSEEDRETFIVVHFLSSICSFYVYSLPYEFTSQTRAWKSEMDIAEIPEEVELPIGFFAPVDVSDNRLGLFSGPGKIAEERCKAGSVDKPSTVPPGFNLINGTLYRHREYKENSLFHAEEFTCG